MNKEYVPEWDQPAVRNEDSVPAKQHAAAVIPPKSNRLDQRTYDRNLSADRNKIERFFGRLKEARGFATRYEKTAVSFLATAHLLAALDWLR